MDMWICGDAAVRYQFLCMSMPLLTSTLSPTSDNLLIPASGSPMLHPALPPSNPYLASTIGAQKPKALPIGDGHLCLYLSN